MGSVILRCRIASTSPHERKRALPVRNNQNGERKFAVETYVFYFKVNFTRQNMGISMKTDILQSLLVQVRWTGSAKIHKRELLWMLGRVNDHASAWSLLLDEWEEIGCASSNLHGIEQGDFITLISQESVGVTTWAGR